MAEEKYVITDQSFTFVQSEESLHDKKFETKRVGFFKDAIHRFAKNKGSVAAAWIILFLVLFAIFSPIVSNHDLGDRDFKYRDRAPLIRGCEETGFWDGSVNRTISIQQYYALKAVASDTGYNPIVKEISKSVVNGTVTYKVRVNTYYEIGAVWTTVTKDEYQKIIDWQNETGLQVLLPYVTAESLGNGWSYGCTVTSKMKEDGTKRKNLSGNYFYQFDAKANAVIKGGSVVPVYAYEKDSGLYYDYDSLRVKSDPAYNDPSNVNAFAYAKEVQGAIEIRVNYYNYYQYQRGETPQYLFGTDSYGKDIFYALGAGARFSLLLAIFVSTINFVLGAIYGSIEGYYGGAADLIMERISDILSGVPLMIVVTLFNLHLASKVGNIPAFLLAFVATGWIGTAALVRKQFYRFKGQEYVLASRTLGANDLRIMFKHIFPNSLGTIVTSCVLVIPGVIGSETMLSYLGIVNLSGDKITSIGTLLADANGTFDSYPHELFFPALFLSLLMISFNLFGNGLRDAFNPALRGADE